MKLAFHDALPESRTQNYRMLHLPRKSSILVFLVIFGELVKGTVVTSLSLMSTRNVSHTVSIVTEQFRVAAVLYTCIRTAQGLNID